MSAAEAKAKKPAKAAKAPKAAKETAGDLASHYDVILAPWITEKATNGSQYNQVSFSVALNATKPQIRNAVQALFKVEVLDVNTLRVKGKTKRFRGRVGIRSDRKKAVVTLKEGQTIDVSTGI